MASFKLSFAKINGFPELAKVADLLEKQGCPEHEEFGVLSHHETSSTLFATIVRKTTQTVQTLDPKTGELKATAVEKATPHSFAVKPSLKLLEVYSGGTAAIEQIGVFFSGVLALPTVVEAMELDVPAAIDKLMRGTQRFQLRSVKLSDYAHNSFMTGPYAPKFLDSEHGRELIEQYADFVTGAGVRFSAATGKVTVTLRPNACLSYSCNEDDQAQVQANLRTLI